MVILGIDPGLAIVGWGLIESHRGKLRPMAYGAITTPAHTPIESRLSIIRQDLSALIEKYKPDEMAVEELFFTNNITTGIAVAEGLDYEEGWRAITRNPARDTGIGDRVGTLEAGKDGDVVIWTADPLTSVGASAYVTVIDGKVVHALA